MKKIVITVLYLLISVFISSTIFFSTILLTRDCYGADSGDYKNSHLLICGSGYPLPTEIWWFFP